MPLSDAFHVVNRLEQAGFTRTQAATLVQAVNAMVLDVPEAAPAPAPPPAQPQSVPAVTLAVLQRELAAATTKLSGASAEQQSWLGRMVLVSVVTNVLTLGAVGTVLYVQLQPSLPLSPDAIAPFAPALAGLVVGVFGLVVARFI